MRILYIDVDTLRPDHLSCYGYHRDTSPNIDRIASQGVRFDNLYATDAPCLPSRTAMMTGQFGIHSGVVNHGGAAADLPVEGARRGFRSSLDTTSWVRCLRNAGLRTVTVSPFGERHSAWHWYANFNEMYNPGKGGMERADEIAPLALDWIARNGKTDDWFLHVNFWDPHTPYRAPAEFGEPFADEPLPGWLTEEVRREHWNGCGPHSAREVNGYDNDSTTFDGDFPRQPITIDSMAEVRRMFDGYDTGVLYTDRYVGQIFDALAAERVLDDTVIVISADHGESLGELNSYGDHQFADQTTSRVPLIVRWPGVTDGQGGRVDAALHYHIDFATTMIELLGQPAPEIWDGTSFAEALRRGEQSGREYLVVSQCAWSAQRAVRFCREGRNWICIRTYHDAHHALPEVMLFDLDADPHEQQNLAGERPEIVAEALASLERWHGEMIRSAAHPVDPFDTVLAEGGPLHSRGQLTAYLARLRATGRGHCAELLQRRY